MYSSASASRSFSLKGEGSTELYSRLMRSSRSPARRLRPCPVGVRCHGSAIVGMEEGCPPRPRATRRSCRPTSSIAARSCVSARCGPRTRTDRLARRARAHDRRTISACASSRRSMASAGDGAASDHDIDYDREMAFMLLDGAHRWASAAGDASEDSRPKFALVIARDAPAPRLRRALTAPSRRLRAHARHRTRMSATSCARISACWRSSSASASPARGACTAVRFARGEGAVEPCNECLASAMNRDSFEQGRTKATT